MVYDNAIYMEIKRYGEEAFREIFISYREKFGKKAVKSNNIFQGHLLSLARIASVLTTATLSGHR